MSRTALSHDGGPHRLDAEDVEGAAQIVGERRQAELGAHIGEAAHQEATTFIGLAPGFALISSTAFAEQGDSSSYGTVGWPSGRPFALSDGTMRHWRWRAISCPPALARRCPVRVRSCGAFSCRTIA
jgi:hypothetical protein